MDELSPFPPDEECRLLPYRMINSELNSSVVHESLLSSDSETIISSSSISLPVGVVLRFDEDML